MSARRRWKRRLIWALVASYAVGGPPGLVVLVLAWPSLFALWGVDCALELSGVMRDEWRPTWVES